MSKQSIANADTSMEGASMWRYRIRQGYCKACGERIRATIGMRLCQKCRGKRLRGVPKGLK